LGFGRIIPEIRTFNQGIDFGQTPLGIFRVKDASSAAQSTA